MKKLALAASLALAGTLVGALAACGSGSGSGDDDVKASKDISAARCAQNKAAGRITYLTGYRYQSSASILEVEAADKLGWFKDLCLDVKLQPGTGDSAAAGKLLAAGKVQVAGLAEQDVMQDNANGIKVTGISSYSDAGLDVLMTEPSVTDLKQLAGKTVGYKGFFPPTIQAMLDEQGLDWNSFKRVVVGYDPTVLTRGQVQGLTGFASNEPNLLKDAGKKVTVWQPADYGVPSSLGSYAVSPAFAKAHPTAVQDFLRAVFRAWDYCGDSGHVDECLGYGKSFAGASFDQAHEKDVWTTEFALAKSNPLPASTSPYSVDLGNVASLAGLLTKYAGLTVDAATAQADFDNSFAEAVVKDGKVVWPAP